MAMHRVHVVGQYLYDMVDIIMSTTAKSSQNITVTAFESDVGFSRLSDVGLKLLMACMALTVLSMWDNWSTVCSFVARDELNSSICLLSWEMLV